MPTWSAGDRPGHRIGRKYLKGAFGYGGPCFPRDNKAFAKFAELNDVDATSRKATDQVNQRQVDSAGRTVLEMPPPGETVGILGMSYKPDTEVIEESQGVMLAHALAREGCSVCVYDPAADGQRARCTGRDGRVLRIDGGVRVRKHAVLVIATPWEVFKALKPEHLREIGAPGDLWTGGACCGQPISTGGGLHRLRARSFAGSRQPSREIRHGSIA